METLVGIYSMQYPDMAIANQRAAENNGKIMRIMAMQESLQAGNSRIQVVDDYREQVDAIISTERSHLQGTGVGMLSGVLQSKSTYVVLFAAVTFNVEAHPLLFTERGTRVYMDRMTCSSERATKVCGRLARLPGRQPPQSGG